MAARRLLFECAVGSHLYGTALPESDRDYAGVFLPSAVDLLGLSACPREWVPPLEEGVDRKWFSLSRFAALALQGQPGQLELLWAPTRVTSPEGDLLRARRHLFASKQGVRPFLGFAQAQAYKATVKGETLVAIRKLLAYGSFSKRLTLREWLDHFGAWLLVDSFTNAHGFPQVQIAGRNFDPGAPAENFLASLAALERRYGGRSEAAAGRGYDYKSLMHACRLLHQAEEWLLLGALIFPRPEADWLLKIRRGEEKADWWEYLSGEIERIQTYILPLSKLPEQPDHAAVEQLVIDMQETHLARS